MAVRSPAGFFPLTRHLSYHLTPLLLRTRLTPNQVTALSMLLGLAGAACFLGPSRGWALLGGVLLVACYTFDNCDGEIARIKNLASPWGAKFDDLADWLVDTAFFAALGVGTALATDNEIWMWLGLAAAIGATIDYIVNLVHEARSRPADGVDRRDEAARNPRRPEDVLDWVIYIFHGLSRADFCFIVLALAVFDSVWILLPLAAVGAQVFWITDLFERGRGYHI